MHRQRSGLAGSFACNTPIGYTTRHERQPRKYRPKKFTYNSRSSTLRFTHAILLSQGCRQTSQTIATLLRRRLAC
jgi:hypothetical protein